MSSPALIPFEVALPQATQDDLAARLARTRFALDECAHLFVDDVRDFLRGLR